jgi:uncharacterized membrane protein (UPF0127 family)
MLPGRDASHAGTAVLGPAGGPGHGRARLVVLCAALLASASTGRAADRVPDPASHVGRDVTVRWHGSGQSVRLEETGVYHLRFPCRHADGEEHTVDVEVQREGELRPYAPMAPAGLTEAAAGGRAVAVRFEDALARPVKLDDDDRAVPVLVPGEGHVRPALAFVTDSGIFCLVPEGAPALDQAASLRFPLRAVIAGRAVQSAGGSPYVLVDSLCQAAHAPVDEPRWTVTVRWADTVVLSVCEAGDHSACVPCAQDPAEPERIELRLREFTVVRVEAGLEVVLAELADTDAARSYGLQGRPGLRPNHGMLFFFPEGARPRFAMKTVTFPLDIAFIRGDGVIAAIEQLSPGDPRSVTTPVVVNYVLEMEQGWFRSKGVQVGGRVKIPARDGAVPDAPPGPQPAR